MTAKYRTYGQWRGYHDVITYTGTGTDQQTETEVTYYQGMSDDNNTTAVTLTDSQRGKHDDTDQLAGIPLETTAYLGAGGPVDHSTIDSYWVSPAVASRTRPQLPALTANAFGQVEHWTRQAITDTATPGWRTTETDTSYDATASSPTFGLPLYTDTHGDLSQPSQETCTAISYAPAGTTLYLAGLVSEQKVTAGACGGSNPDGASAPGSGQVNALSAGTGAVTSDTRTFYDDLTPSDTWPQAAPPAFPQASAPTKGDVSQVWRAITGSGTSSTWQVKSATVYDSYGRPTEAWDGNGNHTKTAYTMTSGVTTKVAVTNTLGQSTTTSYDPLRGLPLTVTDPNNITTTQQYDSLGLLTGVWEYGRPTSDSATLIFSYAFGNATTPTVVTTKTLNDEGGHITSMTLYDALLRPRQSQVPTPQGGILVSDDFYNSDGWEWKTNTDWWDSADNPSSTIRTIPDSQVPDQTQTAYDGLGRPIMVSDYDDSNLARQTATAYYGDTVLTVPPSGGTPTATVTDALDRTTELDSYTSRPTVTSTYNSAGFISAVSISGGTYQAMDYQYGTNGLLSAVKDATTGEQWTNSYNNLLGEVTGTTDPNSGATGMTYDANGNVTQTKNGDGKTITIAYDGLNRKTGEYDGASTSSPQIASWTYDNSNDAVSGMTDPIGHLTTETSTYNGVTYTIQESGYNAFGESTGESVTIPSGQPLAGTYTLSQQYSTTTGLLVQDSYPAAPAPAYGSTPLPAETTTHGYTAGFDLPAGLTGLNAYAQNITWSDLSQVQQEEVGSTTANAYITNAYDPNTGALIDSAVQNTTADPSTAYDDTYYEYDPAGNIIAQTDTRNGSQVETQCFGYDTLDQLSQAWTTATSAGNATSLQPNPAACATIPTAANASTVVTDGIPGSAYWASWLYNTLGDRTSQTQHSLTGGSDTITSYGYGTSSGQPDTLATATTKVGATITGTVGYAPDPAGNTTTLGGQTLTWTDNGKLATDTTSTGGQTSYAYDADGNLLVATDPTSTTVYLFGGAQQMTLVTRGTGAGTITGTRTLDLPGGGQALRTGTATPGTSTTPGTTTTGFSFEFTDQHGTGVLTLASDATTPAWRQYDPFGNPRGTAPATWPDPNNAFLGKPQDTNTGLDIIGARNYDPTTGRFISIDPILQLNSPQALNGYTYANDNPNTNSDPTGLDPTPAYCGVNISYCVNQAYQQEGGQYNSQGIPTGAGISTQICYYCHDYGDYGDYYPPQALPTKAVQTRPQPIRCLGHNFSCLGASQPQTATNLLTWFTHTALPFIARSYDAANNALNTVGNDAWNALNAAGNHLYAQISLCIGGCLTGGLQGNTLYFSVSGFSFVNFRRFSAFFGVSVGFNSAGQRQMVKNNLSVGAGSTRLVGVLTNIRGAAEGFGGGVGASTYVGPNGPGTVYPYIYGTFGEGWQFNSGPVQTWGLTVP